MEVLTYPGGPFQENGYLLICPDSGAAAVVDPGATAPQIARDIRSRQLQVEAVFLTHAHLDHIEGLPDIRAVTDAPIFLHPDDRRLFDAVQATWNLLEPSAAPALETAHASGRGDIVKEALANGRLTIRNRDPEFAARQHALATLAARFDVTTDAVALAAALAVQRPNSRAAETEADQIGIELAAKAGYDPRAAITLWQKMAQVGGKGPPEFFSTHPSPENREQKLAEYVPEMMPYYEQKGDRPFYKL